MIAEIAPEYNVLIAWRTMKLRSVILNNLYPKRNDLDAINCIYKFTCECKVSYIGESENLQARISQHGRESGKTAVFSHLKSCDKYKMAFEALPDANRFATKGKFLREHLTVLDRNLRYDERKVKEALHIKLERPELNVQVAHRSISFI